MKQYGMRVATLALCTAVMGAVPVFAQQDSAPATQGDGAPQGPPPGGRGGHGGQEHRLEQMTKQLNLTPDQVTSIKAIEADSRQQAMALRDDTSTSQDAKHEKMMAIRMAGQAKVRALLNDDQKAKFDAMEARMHERMEHRGGHGEGPDGPPPPPPPAQ